MLSAGRIAPYPRFCMLTVKCRRKSVTENRGLKLYHVTHVDKILLKSSWKKKTAQSYSYH